MIRRSFFQTAFGWVASLFVIPSNRLRSCRGSTGDTALPFSSQINPSPIGWLREIDWKVNRMLRGNLIKDALWTSDEVLRVYSSNDKCMHVPRSAIAVFRDATDEQLHDFEIDSDGAFIYWPDLDVHLGWEQFQQAVDPYARLRAQQTSWDFDRRYGAAIRRLREHRGLTQSEIPGLMQQQVDRVERGERRATRYVINQLADAHDMRLDAYMEALANDESPMVL